MWGAAVVMPAAPCFYCKPFSRLSTWWTSGARSDQAKWPATAGDGTHTRPFQVSMAAESEAIAHPTKKSYAPFSAPDLFDR
jgi:hypothetical protein